MLSRASSRNVGDGDEKRMRTEETAGDHNTITKEGRHRDDIEKGKSEILLKTEGATGAEGAMQSFVVTYYKANFWNTFFK